MQDQTARPDRSPPGLRPHPPDYVGQARYVPYEGAWSAVNLEFDPPLELPAGWAARYTTPPPPAYRCDGNPGPWFPVYAVYEPIRRRAE